MENPYSLSYSLTELGTPESRFYHIYRINRSERSSTPHSHTYFNIVYVDSGEMIHTQGNSEVHLGPGDAFIVPPGLVHSVRFVGQDSYIYSLSFDESILSSAPSSLARLFTTALGQTDGRSPRLESRLRLSLQESQQKTVSALMEALVREQQEADASLSAAAALIEALLCVLARAYFRGGANGEELRNITDYHQLILDCIDYLNDHFAEAISLPALSRRYAMSRAIFSTLFRQYTGITPKKYLTRQRIRHAAFLIRSSKLPLSEIAHMVGYEDFSTFYRSFRREAGCAPSALRDKNTPTSRPAARPDGEHS